MASDDGPDSRTVLVAYGSETGNSQDVAEELGGIAERLHFRVRVCELDSVKAVRRLDVRFALLLRTNSTYRTRCACTCW